MPIDVRHNASESRYEIWEDGVEIGIAEYRLLPGDDGAPTVAEFFHTQITPPLRGRGYGARLVTGALADVRSRGLTVKATCWYVDQFLIEHPDYSDLRA